LLSVGFFIVLLTTRIFNIAYGTMALLFGYIMWMLSNNTSTLVPIAIIIGLSLIFSFLLLPIFKNLPEPVEPNSIIVTFAILLVMEAILTYLFSSDWRIITLNPNYDAPIANNIAVSRLNAFFSLFSVIFISTIYLIAKKTRIGLIFKACIDNESAAKRFGIPVDLVSNIAFIFGTIAMAIAGAVYGMTNYLYPASGIKLTMIAITVTIIAGESIIGILLGGILLGIIESFSGYFLGGNWQDLGVNLLIIVFLIAKESR